MRRPLLPLTIVLSLAAAGGAMAVVACSSDPDTASGPPDGTPTSEGGTSPESSVPGDTGVPAEVTPYVASLCGYFSRCEAIQGKSFESTEACTAHWNELASCQPDLAKVDAATFAACTEYLNTVDCAKPLTDPASPCSAIYNGGPVVKTGERCHTGSLCALGSYCPNPAAQACSTCVAQQPAGGSCTYHFECQTVYCNAGTCTAPVALGQSCAGGALCAGNHACIGGKCQALKEIGAACNDSFECYTGATCMDKKCVRIPSCNRTKDQHCDTTKDCGKDFYCHGPDFTCQPRVAIGESCTEGLEACPQGAFCDIDEEVKCKALPAIGDPCPGTTTCPAGSFCNASKTCEALKADGTACDAAEQCASGACTSMKCGC